MDALKACVEAAVAGGKTIENFQPRKLTKKKDHYVGSHAIVTDADFLSQNAITKVLAEDKDSFFITEEHVKDEEIKKRIIAPHEIEKLKNSGVYIIDELDGSSPFNCGHYEWSTSVGFVKNLVHECGAVFAPKVDMLFYGTRKKSFMKSSKEEKRMRVAKNKLENSFILAGPDNMLTKYPVHNKLLAKLGDNSRTMNVTGSCALGLGLVAAGITDALIQPIQSPWDWAAGKVFIDASGGTMIFYEMSAGKIMPIKKLEPKHYDPSKRAVGFVAANKSLAKHIMKLMLETNSELFDL